MAAPDVAPAEIDPAVLAPEPGARRHRHPRRASAPRPPRPSRPAAGGDEVEQRVLAIVAEQTGYPTDLLDMDLDLEADLGIDTVKQAEVFATIREAYGIERDDSLKLRDYPTLNHVVAFVNERAPGAAARPGAEPAPAAAPARAGRARPAAGDEVEQRVLAIVAEQTGYPPDLLDMDLDLEADLGIDTVKQAEVFATIREAYGIERDDSLKLRDYPTLNHVVAFVNASAGRRRPPGAQSRPAAAAAPPRPAPAAAEPEPPAGGVEVEQRVLAIVAEQTGYPPDLLDMDLDLEADLGIDTVKQAEVFAPSARPTGSSATTRSSCATTRPSTTSSPSSTSAPAPRRRRPSRPRRPPPRLRPRRARAPPAATRSSSGCWRSSPSRPAIRPTCSTWTSTSRPTSGSTRSSRPRCSPHPRGLRDRARRLAQAARLPDPQPRRRLRQPERPGRPRRRRRPSQPPPRKAREPAAEVEGFPEALPAPSRAHSSTARARRGVEPPRRG